MIHKCYDKRICIPTLLLADAPTLVGEGFSIEGYTHLTVGFSSDQQRATFANTIDVNIYWMYDRTWFRSQKTSSWVTLDSITRPFSYGKIDACSRLFDLELKHMAERIYLRHTAGLGTVYVELWGRLSGDDDCNQCRIRAT